MYVRPKLTFVSFFLFFFHPPSPKGLVKTWTVHLCVWIKLVMVQKVGLLRLFGYAFELRDALRDQNACFFHYGPE